MALKAMADNNIPIPARSDAVLYDELAGKVDFVFKNIDEEFKMRIIFPCTKSFPWTAIGYY